MTAEEFFKNNSRFRNNIVVSDMTNIMIEFAKYHVEQALLKASTEATTKTEMVYTGGLDPYKKLYEPEQIIDEDSILNSYPLENIK